MIGPMRSLRLLLALAAMLALALPTVCATPVANASVVEAMSLADLTREAEVIVVARVDGQRARYDTQGRIVTDVSLRIEQSLHGRLGPGARATAMRLGGAVGDLGLRVEGEASYVDGERVILFARWYTTPAGDLLRPIGMSQGVLPITSAGGTELAQPGGLGLDLVAPGPDGRLVPAPAAMSAPRGLDALLDEIRALVRELHAR